VPIQQLPDTFEIETELDIRDQKWTVIQAVPSKKEDFGKTGKLRLILSKVQMVDLKNILFSLPTINDGIFDLETTLSGNPFLFHEDDWRQIEFVSKKYESKIAEEIRLIVEIYENHKEGIGFNKIHIRKLIEKPLIGENLNLPALRGKFNILKEYDGFGVGNGTRKAKNSFAFQLDNDIVLYGQINENDDIVFLCVEGSEKSSESVRKIVEDYNIIYVDWCRAETFTS
jgi:hypothetical protein